VARAIANWQLQIANCKLGQALHGDPEQDLDSASLADRLLDFAARVGKVVDALPRKRLANHIASQLIRCGTAPGSHYEEGCGAESRADFVHKLRLALKELRESRYWLRLIARASLLPHPRLTKLLDECDQLTRIIGKSIVTAKQTEREQAGEKRAPAKTD
jgi:four helix bundle protein